MTKLITILFLVFFVIWCTNNTKIENNQKTMKNYEEQIFTQLSVDDFKKEMSNSWVVIIDVRTPEELPVYWKISNNELLIDINNESFPKQIEKLDKNKKYLVYCWHWNRSAVARDYMKSLGFSYVKDLEWWIDAWTKAGESVIK